MEKLNIETGRDARRPFGSAYVKDSPSRDVTLKGVINSHDGVTDLKQQAK